MSLSSLKSDKSIDSVGGEWYHGPEASSKPVSQPLYVNSQYDDLGVGKRRALRIGDRGDRKSGEMVLVGPFITRDPDEQAPSHC